MASITVPGVVDSVSTVPGVGKVTTITTHPSGTKPGVIVDLVQSNLATPPFAVNDAVNVTIETA